MKEKTGQSEININMELLNSGSTLVAFVLEPWGDAVSMVPGAALRISVQGPRTGAQNPAFQVELGEDRVTWWINWEGAVAQLFSNGVEI
jgi:hypothetical protein